VAKYVLSSPADVDVVLTLSWSEKTFGASASLRYRTLLFQAMRDVAENPDRFGVNAVSSRSRLKTYRLVFSRDRVSRDVGRVKKPRHLLLFREIAGGVEILRILHDSMDIERHLPSEEDG
jgi:toxin ParE1/3/4